MNKKLFSVITLLACALLLLTAVSCKMDAFTESTTEPEVTATGKISGTVQYSNVEGKNHGGIILTLDKTDGLRTLAVSQAVEARSLVPAARALVANKESAADGSYLFENLEPGTYTVYAASTYSSERAVCTNVVVRAAETTVAETLKLTATGSIKGKITLDNSLTGNTGFLVFVAGTSYMAMTDDAGNYTISGVPAGEGYLVVATKNGVIHNLSSDITVTANDVTMLSSNNFTSTELDNTIKGDDGDSIVWKGERFSAPSNPKKNWAYFNTTDGCSYIYNGNEWTLLAKSGTNGSKGKDGTNGDSIVWKGERSTAPSNPKTNWAYFNTTDGCSYIWNGTEWNKLSEKGENGENGVSIVWKGELSADPSNPELNWAYYNTIDCSSYIYDGEKWNLLAKGNNNSSSGAVIEGTTLTGWENPEGDITIPSEVTSIGDEAFADCSGITSITIPDSVTSIGVSAFNNCDNLTSVTIGNGVTSIGVSAFIDCDNLTSVTIGNGVTSIGEYAFYDCAGLTRVNFEGTLEQWLNISFDGNTSNPLYYAHHLYIDDTEVTDLVIPEGVTSIRNTTFAGCSGLTSVTIPDSVTSIGYSAFSGCSGLTSVTIPDSVTSIEEWAFSNCAGLTRVNFEGTIDQWVNISFSDSKSNPLLYAHHLYIDDSELTDLIIPNNVTNIKGYAFYGCSGLTSVTIPDSVTSIESCAFNKCSGLTSVTIGNGVTRIETSTFLGCSGLTSITIPDSVTYIGGSAFKNCSGLTSITIPGSVTSIERGAFSGCSGLTSITIPDSVTSIGGEVFADCNNLTSVNYEGTLEQWLNISFIEFEANPLYYAHHLYINDSEVTDLVIPEGVTSIGNYAFIGCYGLTSITIPDSVTSVGIEMCCDCINLSSITLPDNVTNIGVGAFRNCRALTSITIPDTVTSIKYNTFLKCSGLTSITIPASVTSIEDYAFKECDNLTTVNYCGSAGQWTAISIGSDNSALTGATINYNYTGE